MKKLVIQTQYLENYGDSKDPYMKFKGGDTYVSKGVVGDSPNDIATLVAKVKPYITTDLFKSNGGCEEYITDVSVEPLSKQVTEDWDTPTEFSIIQWISTTNHMINFIKITDNRGEYGFRKKEILEVTETWTNNREDYKAEYLMEDGDSVVGDAGLREWFDIQEKVA